jgi:hypothetical protein
MLRRTACLPHISLRHTSGTLLAPPSSLPSWTRVEKFEPATRMWSEVQPMSQKRMRHGSATVNGQVYVVGGKNEQGQALTSVERYDPHLQRGARSASNLSQPRR